jgi:hypothetical protein
MQEKKERDAKSVYLLASHLMKSDKYRPMNTLKIGFENRPEKDYR